MKLRSKNCAVVEKGQHLNKKEGNMSIIVYEAWCDRLLDIGAGSVDGQRQNYGIKVLDNSPLLADIL